MLKGRIRLRVPGTELASGPPSEGHLNLASEMVLKTKSFSRRRYYPRTSSHDITGSLSTAGNFDVVCRSKICGPTSHREHNPSYTFCTPNASSLAFSGTTVHPPPRTPFYLRVREGFCIHHIELPCSPWTDFAGEYCCALQKTLVSSDTGGHFHFCPTLFSHAVPTRTRSVQDVLQRQRTQCLLCVPTSSQVAHCLKFGGAGSELQLELLARGGVWLLAERYGVEFADSGTTTGGLGPVCPRPTILGLAALKAARLLLFSARWSRAWTSTDSEPSSCGSR